MSTHRVVMRSVLPGPDGSTVVHEAVRATNTTCTYASPLRFASGDRDGQGWHALGDIDFT